MPDEIQKLDKDMGRGEEGSDIGLKFRPHSDKVFRVEGLGWYGRNDDYTLRRLPADAEKKVPESVWNLSQHPSGGRIRFATNSSALTLKITQPERVMLNMCPIGHSGVDLYIGPPTGAVHWNTTRPDLEAMKTGETYEYTLFEGVEKKLREITLYLPTYNRLDNLEIGLDEDAQIKPPADYPSDKRIVFYGTSITQGGCSSRTGDNYVAIIGRMLGCDVVNLGFSGNGRGEPEVAEYVAQLEADIFVLDYEANAGLAAMRENLLPFAEIIRKVHPKAPVMIISKMFFSRTRFNAGERNEHSEAMEFFAETAARLNHDWPAPTVVVDGWDLIGPDTPCAYVDVVHPNDHGFAMMAENLAPVLKTLL